MKPYKSTLTAVMLAVAMLIPIGTLPLLTGCATTSTGQVDEQTIQDVAIALRSAARSASLLAVEDNADNVKYVQLAVTVLDQFLVGDDYTPGALVKALEPVLKDVNDAKIKIAINTVTDLYEAFYGRYVRGQVKANATAFLLLKYIRDGAAAALPAPPAPGQ